MSRELEELAGAVAAVSPQIADAWEATACVESFGYTDRAVAQDFGLANTRVLGERIYAELASASANPTRAHAARASDTVGGRIRAEVGVFLRTFSSSFVYSLPWILMFFLEHWRPDALRLPPDFAAPLNLALMASLITSGGFIQAIARKGGFYLCLEQSELARRICARIRQLGAAVTALVAVGAGVLALYFDIFDGPHVAAGATYYVILSVLWMTCAVISLENHRWGIPVVFCGGALAFLLCRAVSSLPILLAQLLAAAAALALAEALARRSFDPERPSPHSERVALPPLPALVYSLSPYFLYGLMYFAFVFADRIAAGSAVPFASGLAFGIDPDYKRGMDYALLAFLLVAGFVEYFSHEFMHLWYEQAAVTGTDELARLRAALQRRHRRHTIAVIVAFASIAIAELWVLPALRFAPLNPAALRIFLIGGLGYLLFSLGLYDGLILFSVNRLRVVLRALWPALVVNFVFGYTLSHMLSVGYAAGGLLLGAIVFALISRRAVARTFRQADYAYYAA